MPLPKISATHYHAQVSLPDKGREIKGLVVCNSCDVRAYTPALLLTVPWGMN